MARVYGLLLVIATSLPISCTVRVSTESFLTIGKDNVAQQTSDALQDQADKYHEQLEDQKRALAEYEKDKIRLTNDLTFKEEELKRKDKWYKAHFWEIWSDELPNLRNQIGTLKNQVAKIEESIAAAKEELQRLQESKKKTATAQSLVEDQEATIQNLQDQIGIKQQEKKLAEDQHLEDLTAAQALADENLRMSEKRLVAIAEKIAKHDAELQLLADQNHDVQKANKEAQGLLEDAIADYETQIKDLDGQIFVNQGKVEELVKDQNEAKTKYDASIQQLEELRSGLITQRNELQKQMKSAYEKLAKVTQEGNAQIASLQSELESERDQLKEDLAAARANLHNERIENEANLAMLKNQQGAEIARITAELKSLQDSVASSLGAVKALSAEVADSVALSATIQMAVADLKAQKKVQEDEKESALRDIEKAKVSLRAKSDELRSAGSWYKFWYWRIWSSHKKRLEDEIAFFQRTIGAANIRKDKHQAQMVSLQNQIDDAVNSLSSQGTLQKEKAELKGEFEQNIVEVNTQITAQKAQRDATEAVQQDVMKREEEKNNAEIAQFQDMVAKLEAEKQQTVKSLEEIQDNKHDQQQALHAVQENLQAIIAGYHNEINQMSDSIQVASKEIAREEEARDDHFDTQNDVIDGLKTHQATMGQSRAAAASSKVNEEARLEALKQAHGTEEATLTKTVMESRQELDQTNNLHTTNYEAERSRYARELQDRKTAHDNNINELDAEIKQIKERKTKVQAYIQDITDKAVE